MTTSSSSAVITEEAGGCFCRPSRRSIKSKPLALHRSIYHEASDGGDLHAAVDEQATAYFDAVEHEDDLGDDPYPIITTTTIRPRKRVSILQPETLLDTSNDENGATIPHKLRKQPKRLSVILNRMSTSTNDVEEPRILIKERGFPGSLNKEELAECLRFSVELQKRDRVLAEIVYDFRDFEEEPYALCRFLRATKFDGDKMLERLERTKGLWLEAKKNDFYANIREFLGCPVSLFLSQYSFVKIGNAKNGCPVNYFKAGKINPEGILCVTTIKQAASFFWYQTKVKFKEQLKAAHEANPDFVRMEGINIIDLKGLSASVLSSETMDVVKLAGVVSDFFVETLHCMIILNAPAFFAVSWGIIRKLIDPRTAKRIQLFSNESKGLSRVMELIDKSQVPSDYGGSNTSVDNAIMQASGGQEGRQEVDMLSVQKRGMVTHSFELKKGERAIIQLHTRSASSAKFICSNEETAEKVVELEIRGAVSTNSEGVLSSAPICREIAMGASGPGKFVLEGQDLDDASKDQGSLSRGYFLVEKHIL